MKKGLFFFFSVASLIFMYKNHALAQCPIRESDKSSFWFEGFSEDKFSILTSTSDALAIASIGIHPYDTKLTSQQSETSQIISDAPLAAIGKITYQNDALAPALCTATLVGGDTSDLIVTSGDCIDQKSRAGEWFWPASSPDNPAPHGSAKILKFFIDESTGLAVAKLDRRFSIKSFTIHFSHGIFYLPWQNISGWNLTGYWVNHPRQIRMETGCAVTHVEFYYNQQGLHLDRYLSLNAEANEGSFLDGSPFFSNLCGAWTIVGIKTSKDGGKLALFDPSCAFESMFEKWGDGPLSPSRECSTPDPGNTSVRMRH